MIKHRINHNVKKMLLSKANIARALKIAPSEIMEVEVWAFTVWVKAKKLCRILGWKTLISAFNSFRKAGAEKVEICDLTEVFGVAVGFATGTAGKYRLELGYDECWCSCEDYQQQKRMWAGALCKHGWKLISLLGRSPQSILSQQII